MRFRLLIRIFGRYIFIQTKLTVTLLRAIGQYLAILKYAQAVTIFE